MELIFFIGAIQSFFWVLLILNKKEKGIPDFILATWILIIGFNIFLVYLQYTPFDYKWWPYMLGINSGLPNLHGPLLLLYIQFQQKKYDRIKPLHLLHLIPFITTNLLLIKQYMLGKDELIFWIENTNSSAPLNLVLNEILVTSCGVFYIIWSWIELRRHEKKIGQYYSYTQNVNLHWLRNLIIGLGGIWIVVLFTEYFFWFLPETTQSIVSSSAPIYFFASVFVFFIGFYGIKQGVIFSYTPIPQVDPNHEPDFISKYQRSGLDKKKAEDISQELVELMEFAKPYLESKLTLSQLAEKLSLQQNHLSQVINDQLDSNFYEFINGYRLKEFKKRIESDTENRLTILGHAFESGFSSKSTFNEIFKKLEGITPSQFVKQPK